MGKVRTKDMRKGLRFIGEVIRIFSPPYSEKIFHKENAVLDRFVKGLWFGRKTKAEEKFIERPDGTKLRVLVVRSENGTNKNATGLLWMHGGGYAIGAPEQDFIFVDPFCRDGNCVAVMPAYTRSTEKPYPAAIEDCYLALRWMKENAEELGINRNQLFTGGDSAGGGLCAGLCLLARDRGEVNVAFQMPLYPMIDDRMITESAKDNDAPVWNSQANELAWKVYLRGVEGEVPAYAAPARAKDLSDLPPFCTYIGSIEPFYDETVEFAKRLSEAGVPVEMKVYEGCFHAFDLMGYPGKTAKDARKFLMENFRYAQKNYFREN